MASRKGMSKPELSRWAFTALLAVIAFYAVRLYGDPSPLGRAIPVTEGIYTIDGISVEQTSLLRGEVAPGLLEYLAPQEDGVPPLDYYFDGGGAGFSMGFPWGTEVSSLGETYIYESGLFAIAEFHMGQPLARAEFLIPPRDAELSHEKYIESYIRSIKRDVGDELTVEPRREYEGYWFECFEYYYPSDSPPGHYVLIGPFGPRNLVVQFTYDLYNTEWALKYIDKIMASFIPGERLKEFVSDNKSAPVAE